MYQVFSFLSNFFTEPLQVNREPMRAKYVNAVSPATDPLHVNEFPLSRKYVNSVSPSTEPFITDKLIVEYIRISVQYFKYEISIPFILGAFVASVKAS